MMFLKRMSLLLPLAIAAMLVSGVASAATAPSHASLLSEDDTAGVKTTGEDNVLRLTIVVSQWMTNVSS
jgi:hypothetical protein